MENDRCPGCMELKSGGAVCEHCGFDESRKNAPHQLQIGTVLQDKYLVGRALGQGGFGITYLGWNRYLDTKVAIKEYYPSVFVDRNTAHDTTVTCRTEQMEEYFTENRIRFLREAKVLAKLKEVPQIVSILDFFEANNTAYIVMEYLQGYDLKAYIRKKGGRLSPTQTFNIMRPVMAALAQVHEAGLVHRDISPDNIMLQYDGSVKLMDFGAVRSVHNAAVDKELTEATQAIVKHGFAPMEQYSSTGAIGPWTDEYALCATMYYCMTGKVPQNVHDRLEEDKDVDWDSIEGLTETQREILRKGIALRAKDRYRSIREMMDALFAQPKPVPQPEPKPEPPKPKPEPPKPKPEPPKPKPEPPKPEQEPPKPEPAKPGKKKKGIALLAAAVCAAIALVIILGVGSGKPAVTPTEPAIAVPEPVITEPPTEPAITAPPTEPEAPLLIEKGHETISAGGFHTVGLKADGTVVAVGWNLDGQCNVSGWTDIVAIGAGYAHTIGLKSDGTVVAVGSNRNGQCEVSGWRDIIAVSAGVDHTVGLKADGTVVAVSNNDDRQCNVSDWRDIVAVSAGAYHTVGLKSNGTVVAVGHNLYGQCDVSGWRDIVAISAGCYHTVGLKSDGTVVAVGDNENGQCNVSGWNEIMLPSGTNPPETEPVRTEFWRSPIAASNHTVGLQVDGTVVAVGNNDYGQCNVSGWRDIVAVNTGEKHTVGLKADGTVVALGDNRIGKCDVSDWQDIVAISASNYHTVGLKADGTVVAVGSNENGQCEVSGWKDIVAISAGGSHTVGLKADGTVVAVGNNGDGRCEVSGWRDIVAVSAGYFHTIGLKADGTVVAVGNNEVGKCEVSGWRDIVAIGAGYAHTIGLKSDGTVVAAGSNVGGQCDVSSWTDIVAISAGDYHTVGLKADGTVVAVGSNRNGQCDVSGWRDIRLP